MAGELARPRDLLFLPWFLLLMSFVNAWNDEAIPKVEGSCSRYCVAENCDTFGIRYGKFCGVGWSGCPGEKPCDDLDACCMAHDECATSHPPAIHNGLPSLQANRTPESHCRREENPSRPPLQLRRSLPRLRLPPLQPLQLDFPARGSPKTPPLPDRLARHPRLRYRLHRLPLHLPPLRPMPIPLHLRPAHPRRPSDRHPGPTGPPRLPRRSQNLPDRPRARPDHQIHLRFAFRNRHSRDPNRVRLRRSARLRLLLNRSSRRPFDPPRRLPLLTHRRRDSSQTDHLNMEAAEGAAAASRRGGVERRVSSR
ncbi:uncharacterized protein LOC110025292 isoform X5 [Phalaenopsis equestris]|uniref:uncharacterized protein LOC110025292 isoform X5 n=1 Tax=Phalaenopsis equestris TaxID=78828 RepID=UPI0009E50A97|nr:uncharacterized protein LOC110025292 isoform X5 [Phalaenopsis equestris]